MAWTFRRSINLGPFRINLSKKGAGFSFGVPGFRVGHDATGRNYTQTSIPGTGIYNRQYYKSNPAPAPQQQPPVPSAQPKRLPSVNRYFMFLIGVAILTWIVLKILAAH